MMPFSSQKAIFSAQNEDEPSSALTAVQEGDALGLVQSAPAWEGATPHPVPLEAASIEHPPLVCDTEIQSCVDKWSCAEQDALQ